MYVDRAFLLGHSRAWGWVGWGVGETYRVTLIMIDSGAV